MESSWEIVVVVSYLSSDLFFEIISEDTECCWIDICLRLMILLNDSLGFLIEYLVFPFIWCILCVCESITAHGILQSL